MVSSNFYISDPPESSSDIKESILFYLTKIIKLLSINLIDDVHTHSEQYDILPICELLNSLCIGMEAVLFHGLCNPNEIQKSITTLDKDSQLHTLIPCSSLNDSENILDSNLQYSVNISNISFWTLSKALLINEQDGQYKLGNTDDISKEFCEILNNELFNFAIITNNYKILEHISTFSAYMDINDKIKMFEEILSPHTLGKSWIRYIINEGVLLNNLITILYVLFYRKLSDDIGKDLLNYCKNEDSQMSSIVPFSIDTISDFLRKFPTKTLPTSILSQLMNKIDKTYLPHAFMRDQKYITSLVEILTPLCHTVKTNKQTLILKSSKISLPKLDILSPIIYYPAPMFNKEYDAIQSKLSTASLIVAGYRPYFNQQCMKTLPQFSKDYIDLEIPLQQPVKSITFRENQSNKDCQTKDNYCYDKTLDEYIPIGEELDENDCIEAWNSIPLNTEGVCNILGVKEPHQTSDHGAGQDYLKDKFPKGNARIIKNPVIAEILENKFSQTRIDTGLLTDLASKWQNYLSTEALPTQQPDHRTAYNSRDSSLEERQSFGTNSKEWPTQILHSSHDPNSTVDQNLEKNLITYASSDSQTGPSLPPPPNSGFQGSTQNNLKESWSSPASVLGLGADIVDPETRAGSESTWSLLSDGKSSNYPYHETKLHPLQPHPNPPSQEEFESLKAKEAILVDDISDGKRWMPYPPIEGTLASLYYAIFVNNHPNFAHHTSLASLQKFLSLYDTIQNERGLDLQNNVCSGMECGRPIGFGTDYRVCHYDGFYYCHRCHGNDSSPIPARILHNWDFKLYKVSRHNKALLDTSLNDPLIQLIPSSPLYSLIPGLKNVRRIRRALLRFYTFYLSTCSLKTAQKFLMNRDHVGDFVTALSSPRPNKMASIGGDAANGANSVPTNITDAADLYSVTDLSRRRSNYYRSLRDVLLSVESHVTCCHVCSAKRLICPRCHQNTTPKPTCPSTTLNSNLSPDTSKESNPISARIKSLIEPCCEACQKSLASPEESSRSNFYISPNN